MIEQSIRQCQQNLSRRVQSLICF